MKDRSNLQAKGPSLDCNAHHKSGNTPLRGKRISRCYHNHKDCGPSSWWWLEKDNEQHIHELSVAFEILRRTYAYRRLRDKMTELFAPDAIGVINNGSFVESAIQRHNLLRRLEAMLPQSPPCPREIHEMLRRWQQMIANGWLPEQTYLIASAHAMARCTLPDGKVISIPVYDLNNKGIPVILPRQVASEGQTSLYVALCKISAVHGQPPSIDLLAGVPDVSDMLRHILPYADRKLQKQLVGSFVVVSFQMFRPPAALKARFYDWLKSIAASGQWPKEDTDWRRLAGRVPLLPVPDKPPDSAIAFFPAHTSRSDTEKAFDSLIRPRSLKRRLPAPGQ